MDMVTYNQHLYELMQGFKKRGRRRTVGGRRGKKNRKKKGEGKIKQSHEVEIEISGLELGE